MKNAAKFIVAINVITALLGIAVMGISIYVWVTYAENGFDALVQLSTVYAALAFGGIVFLFSFLGCYAAKENKRALLVVYLIFLFIVFAIEVAAAALFAMWSGQLDVDDNVTSDQRVSFAANTFARRANNGALSIYATCCAGCPEDVCDVERLSVNDFTDNNCNTTSDPFSSVCEVVYPCASAFGKPNEDACYATKEGAANLTTAEMPTDSIAGGVCKALSEVEFLPANNTNAYVASPLVGDFNKIKVSSCGRGDPVAFRANLYEYARGFADTLVIAFAVLATVQMLLLLTGSYLVCCAKKEVDQ